MFQSPPKVPSCPFTGIWEWLGWMVLAQGWGCAVSEDLTGAEGSISKLTHVTIGRWLQFLVMCAAPQTEKEWSHPAFYDLFFNHLCFILFIREESLSLVQTQQGWGGYIHTHKCEYQEAGITEAILEVGYHNIHLNLVNSEKTRMLIGNRSSIFSLIWNMAVWSKKMDPAKSVLFVHSFCLCVCRNIFKPRVLI